MRINWSFVKGLFLLGLVVFLYAFSSFKNNSRPLSSINIEFTGEDNVFITSEMVNKLLIQSHEKLYFLPKEGIDLKEMEFLLESNDMIKSAQVYLTLSGEIRAKVEQKRPIARVYSSDVFYIDEDGFRIVPKSMNHKLEKYAISCDTNIIDDNSQFASLNKDMYEIINAKKGDVFIFESGLLHQGFCKSSRLHFHLRHEKSKAVFNNNINTNIYNFTDNLLPNYDVSEIELRENLFKNDLRSTLLRLKNTVVYFFPRFKLLASNLRGKIKQEIKASSFWQ